MRPGRKGQLKQLKCRVCEEPMNRQSYKVHLKLKHGLDTNDLREFGQNTVFGIKRKVTEIQEDSDAEDNGKEGEEDGRKSDEEGGVERVEVTLEVEVVEPMEEEVEDTFTLLAEFSFLFLLFFL